MYEKDCVARKNRLCSDLPYFVFANYFIWYCNSLFEAIISQWHSKMPQFDARNLWHKIPIFKIFAPV